MRRPLLTVLMMGAVTAPGVAQSISRRVEAVMARPEFAHAFFGIEFFDLDTGKAVYRLNGDKFFTPASTTKLLTVGTALELLGADYRFHTRVYRTGPISAAGVLEGDLVLVASGDPNLSGRIRPDGTLGFKDIDHSYAGEVLEGDPLLVLRAIAAQVEAKGIKRIRGRVMVDASLFHGGDAEGGTGIIISPIVVNDNIVDVTITPGRNAGAPAVVTVSPMTAYLRLTAKVTTGAVDSKFEATPVDVSNPDGTHSVTLTASIPQGSTPKLLPWGAPDPARYAEVLLAEVLQERGIVAAPRQVNESVDPKVLAAAYADANLVAEHISPPLSEEAKVTLKVSQNLHASMLPRIVGAVIGRKPEQQAGFDLEREFLTKAGLDVGSASQGDGAGASAHYTPDFMVSYLAWMAKSKSYPAFFAGLPVLGKDGTLWNIQTGSAAAGKVHGKTGTFGIEDRLNQGTMVTAKGLAGYFTRPDGKRFAFAVYVNNVIVKADQDIGKVVGQAIGEIAAAGYLGH